jgi:hypothetical protein
MLRPLLIALSLAAPAAVARGDDCRTEVDLDSLSACVAPAGRGWSLKVEYEVDIENPRRGAEYLLVLRIVENGRLLCDSRGQAIEIVRPLADDLDDDADEAEYDDKVSILLPAGVRADCLRVTASVVENGSADVLDHDDTKVDHPIRYGPRYGRRVGVYVGIHR